MEFFGDLLLILGVYYLVKAAVKKGVKEVLEEVNKNGEV